MKTIGGQYMATNLFKQASYNLFPLYKIFIFFGLTNFVCICIYA